MNRNGSWFVLSFFYALVRVRPHFIIKAGNHILFLSDSPAFSILFHNSRVTGIAILLSEQTQRHFKILA